MWLIQKLHLHLNILEKLLIIISIIHCKLFNPYKYKAKTNQDKLPHRDIANSDIYLEVDDNTIFQKLKEISLVNMKEKLEIIYLLDTGNINLRLRYQKKIGTKIGKDSSNTLSDLDGSNITTKEWNKNYLCNRW